MISDTSRYILSENNEITIRLTGRQWLDQPVGKDRRLPATKLDTLMTEEEFVKMSDLTSE